MKILKVNVAAGKYRGYLIQQRYSIAETKFRCLILIDDYITADETRNLRARVSKNYFLILRIKLSLLCTLAINQQGLLRVVCRFWSNKKYLKSISKKK